METKKNIVLITNSDHGDDVRAGVFTKSLQARYNFTVVDLGKEQSEKITEAKPELVIDLRLGDAEDIEWLTRNTGSKLRKIVYSPRAELKEMLAQLGIETMDFGDLLHAIHNEATNILEEDKSTTD